ncbi:hypothetical protein D3C81_763760 [compost metagenome]
MIGLAKKLVRCPDHNRNGALRLRCMVTRGTVEMHIFRDRLAVIRGVKHDGITIAQLIENLLEDIIGIQQTVVVRVNH